MLTINVSYGLIISISWTDGTKSNYEHVDEVRFNGDAPDIIELIRYVRIDEDGTTFDDDNIYSVNYIVAKNVFEIMVKRFEIGNEEDKNENDNTEDDSN